METLECQFFLLQHCSNKTLGCITVPSPTLAEVAIATFEDRNG
jgi:hypothetical protein